MYGLLFELGWTAISGTLTIFSLGERDRSELTELLLPVLPCLLRITFLLHWDLVQFRWVGLLSFSLPEPIEGWDTTPVYRRCPRGEPLGETRGDPRGEAQGEPLEVVLWLGEGGTSRLDDPGRLGRVRDLACKGKSISKNTQQW